MSKQGQRKISDINIRQIFHRYSVDFHHLNTLSKTITSISILLAKTDLDELDKSNLNFLWRTLRAISFVEVANIFGVLPNAFTLPELRVNKKLFNDPGVRLFCYHLWGLYLPLIHLWRASHQPARTYAAVGDARQKFRRFSELDIFGTCDGDLRHFLNIAHGQHSHLNLASLLEVVSNPSAFPQDVKGAASGISPQGERNALGSANATIDALAGFEKFFRFASCLADLIRDSDDYPLFSSSIWVHFSNFFPPLSQLIPFIDEFSQSVIQKAEDVSEDKAISWKHSVESLYFLKETGDGRVSFIRQIIDSLRDDDDSEVLRESFRAGTQLSRIAKQEPLAYEVTTTSHVAWVDESDLLQKRYRSSSKRLLSMVLLQVLPHVDMHSLAAASDSWSDELNSLLIAAVFQIEDERIKTSALSSMAGRLTPEVARLTLTHIADFRQEENKAGALMALAPNLTRQDASRATEIAQTVKSDYLRLLALAEMSRHFSDLRGSVLAQIQNSQHLDDEALRDLLMRMISSMPVESLVTTVNSSLGEKQIVMNFRAAGKEQ